MKKVSAVLLLLLLNIQLGFSQDLKVETTKEKGLGYVTHGYIDFDSIYMEELKTALMDLPNYNNWSLTGLDGKDEKSKDDIGILERFHYISNTKIMDIRYTVNLFWPFGSKDNSILLKTETEDSDGFAEVIFVIKEKSSAIKKGRFQFAVLKIDENTYRLQVYAAIELTWIIDLFVSKKKYKEAVEKKFLIMAKNLLNYSKKQYISSNSGVDKK